MARTCFATLYQEHNYFSQRMTFSQRMGVKPITKNLQLNSIDDDLRNSLWNLALIHIITKLNDYSKYVDNKTELQVLCIGLWSELYKKPIDEVPENSVNIKASIKKKFFEASWSDAYEFIIFLADYSYYDINKNRPNEVYKIDSSKFRMQVNKVLEIESSAYRFINNTLVPISNELEINEIKQVLVQHHSYTSLHGVNVHFTSAMAKFSDRDNPDYRNSIKESISAVEALCRTITGESTLGDALISLEKKGLSFNAQLKAGFIKIYAYTNAKENGIRHAIVEDFVNPDFNDAKYMLVSCSAFANFIIGKCLSLNITIN